MDTYGANGENNSGAWFVGIIVALALLAIGYLVFAANTSPQARGGLDFLVLTDAGTGCEYLSRNNALTPRLDADGKHVCPQAGDTR